MKAQNILETIGNTPHVRVARLFPDAGYGSNPSAATQAVRSRIASLSPWWKLLKNQAI